jgi:hypothetical protein
MHQLFTYEGTDYSLMGVFFFLIEFVNSESDFRYVSHRKTKCTFSTEFFMPLPKQLNILRLMVYDVWYRSLYNHVVWSWVLFSPFFQMNFQHKVVMCCPCFKRKGLLYEGHVKHERA